jgi:WD40-like Beta Propeller Repeat
MRRARWRQCVLVTCTLLAWSTAPSVVTGDAIRCAPESTLPANPFETHFNPFRLGVPGHDRHYRDLEVMWDSVYTGGLNFSAIQTISNFISAVDDSLDNPFGIPKPDFELIYEYFRRNSTPYSETVSDTASVLLGVGADDYNPSDRSHSDVYLFEKAQRQAQVGALPDGSSASLFTTPDEDVSTGHAADYAAVMHANSVMIMGPSAAAPYDVSGAGWTKPDQLRNAGFCHELQHSIPGSGGLYSEFFSALAEVIGGTQDQSAPGEVPYVWPLVAYGGSASCGNVLTVDTNYKARTAFGAYVAYNFRGQDTTATLAALRDDLGHKWAVGSGQTLAGLRDLLSDSNCWDCAQRAYFHPGGVAMDNVGRLGLLLHNWRVANYVNNSFLDEHQYGFPPQLGSFSPAKMLKAWQAFDGCDTDDVVAIPPEVVLSLGQAARETTFVGNRRQGPYSFPMALEPLGSEYWVLRCDPSAWTSGQDLVVRVTPEDFYYREHFHSLFTVLCTRDTMDGRLYGSVMPYSPPDGNVLSGQLWQHPEWATSPIAPTWTAVDSATGALEYVLPNFGSSVKDALVTLSFADGPKQSASKGAGISTYIAALPYRVSFALRKGAYQAQNPWPQAASASTYDEDAAWAPTGDSLAFTRRSSGVGKIYLKPLAGSPSQLLAGSPSGDDQSKPDWSPRGDYLLFTLKPSGSGQEDLWVYNHSLGADLRKISPNSGLSIEGVFQPNGQGAAYVRHVTSPEELWEVNRVNLDGSGYTLLAVRYGGASLTSPRWSPDGRWVYFTSNDTLYAVGATDSVRGSVVARTSIAAIVSTFDLPTGRGPIVLEQPGQYSSPVVCDGSGTACSECNGTPPTIVRAFRRVALTDTLRHDTQARFYVTSASFYGPRWSPEGTRVAYATNQNLASDRDIYVGQTSFDHAPAWTNPSGQLADQSIPAGVGWAQQLNATDADGEPMTFVGAMLPSGASVVTDNPNTGAGRFIWPNPGPVGATYYFALRSLDPSGGVASKVVKYTVIQTGGGGGCPFAETKTATGWQTENSVLGRSADASLALDAYRLKNAPAVAGNQLTLRLRENEAEVTTLDRVRLAVVDHAAGTELFPDGEQQRVGTRQAAYRVTTAGGTDVTSQMNGSGYQGMPGDTLYVQMSAPGMAGSYAMNSTMSGGGGDGLLGGDEKDGYLRYDPGSGLASMSSTGASPAMTVDQATLTETGIRIQASDGAGGWRDVRRYYPRAYASEAVLDSLGGSDLRLIFVGKHHLNFVGRIIPAAGSPTVTVLSPTAAVHNRLGNVKSALLTTGTTTQLATGDTLTLSFAVPATTANTIRDYTLLTDGVYTTPAPPARLTPQATQLPVRFALGQNVPNPFSGTTTIRFELPQSSRVRIEVFDLLGRRIRTLADNEWPAGYHAVEWDRRDDAGHEIHSGVLVYRMTAGAFRDQKKMVITPR